ncbi:MAG TPA: tRNA (adenosine(37)-N6)-dimethylallyltransferase MiaA [Melioribacteraceae bacterium]|nr:tRNA (adenosine(37)-N6)-dimethylallyltransferase MiaA [Melioribacteraceae bacterium]
MGRQVIVIAGPTCSGKTAIGIKLAKLLNGEVISADSRQIYKYLSIGTAKPTIEERKQVKHHLIDFLQPDEEYNVCLFEQDSLKIINELFEKNIQPIIVGGSGLYIKALTEGIFEGAETDEELRNNLHKRMDELGIEALLNELKIVDPESAEKMLPTNYKRIIRALEVFYLTGKTISDFQKEYKREINISFIQFMLNFERETLYKRIEKRVDNMINLGLVEEVNNILSLGFNKKMNSLNTVGYKEIFDYLDNNISLEKAIELIKRNTRRYAKRQFTWFNGQKNFIKIDINDNTDINSVINLIIEKVK